MVAKAAVFCHNGLGDGVVSLVLSNNLHLNGWRVDTYQNAIGSMQNWFPHLSVLEYPPECEIERLLSSYDWFFVVHNDTSSFIRKLIAEGKRRFPEKTKVFYLYPSSRIVREPYYQDACIDPTVPIADNFQMFCEKMLKLGKITSSNGFIPPEGLTPRRYASRVVIHPTGSRRSKNWSKEKFIELAFLLQKRGYEPVFVPGREQYGEWEHLNGQGIRVELFDTLDLLARFVYESGYFIGNDSGLGHLASFLDIPTLTIARSHRYTRLSRPSYARGAVVTPSAWIPNISGFRLRDMHWKRFISVSRVFRSFGKLCSQKELKETA